MGDEVDDCVLNVFTNSKERNVERKKRKAIAEKSSKQNKNNLKSNSDPSSCHPPEKKKFRKQKNDDEDNGKKSSKGNPIIQNRGDDNNKNNDNNEDDVKKKISKKPKTKEKEQRGGAGHVLTKDRPFISNLFTKNPEAPASLSVNDAQRPEPNQGEERVFSSADVEANQFQFHVRINSILKGQFGIQRFTQVQLAAIPKILQGRDTLVKSQTGSGKTLAYALPIIHSLMTRDPKIDRVEGPYAIVIVPTRELVLQGFETFNKLCAGCTWIVPGQLMGGEKKKSEKARLRKGVNILVATPGRLLDHLNTTEIFQKQLPSLDFLVFDEADRLMDLGFEKDLNEIIAKIVEFRGAKKRTLQSILASATLNDDVLRLVRLSLYDPVTIDTAKMAKEDGNLGDVASGALTTPSTLRHHFLVCPHKLRLVALASLVLEKCRYSSTPSKLIVFVATLKCVDFFVRLFDVVFNSIEMTDADHDAARATGVRWQPILTAAEEGLDDADFTRRRIVFFGLHGEMPQEERTKTYRKFKGTGKADETSQRNSSVLFCTDVGARGLDVADIAWIIQFHPPGPPEDYVHRVGRCARAGSEGNALLFLTPTETEYVTYLREKAALPKVHEVPLLKVLSDGLLPGALKYLEGGGGKKEKSIKMEDAATCVQLKMENVVALSAADSTTSSTTANDNEVETSPSDDKDKTKQSWSDLAPRSKAAYFSFIRSYATYPKELKRIGFNVPSLHLGHVAKSFALREPPSKMKDAQGNVKQEKKRKAKTRKDKNKNKLKQLSEFSSGL